MTTVKDPQWQVSFPHQYLLKELGEDTVKRKLEAGLCKSHGCRRRKAEGKHRCHTCRSRLKRMRDELGYVYRNLGDSAAKRGIPFQITKKEFGEFCRSTGYLEKRGVGNGAMTVDRIDPRRGYAPDNIRIMEFAANSAKGSYVPEDIDYETEDCPYGPP